MLSWLLAPSMINSSLLGPINELSLFLARRDAPSVEALPRVDLLVLLGSAVIDSVDVAAHVIQLGKADRMLISGGIGHSTRYLEEATGMKGLSEAEIFRRWLVTKHGLEPDLIEVRSTNCGENANFTWRMLDDLGLNPRKILLIQDPTMQRRSHATFEKVWGGSDADFISYAPFVPWIDATGDIQGSGHLPWTTDRFTGLLLGEIDRLRDDENGYGPRGKGFIGHIEMPHEVERAYATVRAAFSPRIIDSGQ